MPKTELIRPWSTDLSKVEPLPYPFKVGYRKSGKSLTFIASNHENYSESQTLKLIEKEILEQQYDLLFLEGFPSNDGISPNSLIDWAKQDGKNGFFVGGETSFAIQLAISRGIQFQGGEILDSSLKKELLKTGWTEQDLLYFYFVRQIPQFVRAQTLKPHNLKSVFDVFSYRERHKLEISSGLPLSFEGFYNWYKGKNKRDFKYTEIDNEITAPLADGTYFTQKLSAQIGMIRDQHISQVIAEKLRKYNKILVIYGGSHWSTQRLVFEDWFGKPYQISNS